MGLLSLGTPFDWEEARKHAERVRALGIVQLIKMFEAASERSNDEFLWGDEIEYMLLKVDKTAKTAKLAIDEDFILERLSEEGVAYHKAVDNDISFHPEYGRFMLEATPLKPYHSSKISHFLGVEANMNVRRTVAVDELPDPSIIPLTLTSFPRMGAPHFTYPDVKVDHNSASKSLFLPDELINRHVRFPTLTANIRRRRGAKVAINVPLYRDTNTRLPADVDPTIPHRDLFPLEDQELFNGAAEEDSIYMDSMGFGMGCSCLQITMQALDLHQSRYLYDSLLNIAPLMLALTALAPIFRGFLAAQDVRWNVISGSVDDRTPFERGVPPLAGHNAKGGLIETADWKRIPKSRYDSIDQYLGDIQSDGSFKFFKNSYNDLLPVKNEKVYKTLTEKAHFDSVLLDHFAHLFIRDPIVIFSEKLDQDNDTSTDHFENVQSTNWQTLRFKPPTQLATPDNKSAPGWRVEFRPMEISITDFENAAFGVFIPLISKAILKYKPNFYIPISCIEKNMKTAHKMDAAVKGMFYFRKDITNEAENSITELSLDQIFNGCEEFVGLIPLVEKYIAEDLTPTATEEESFKLSIYLKLISLRALGEIPTTARFIRDFVLKHPSYAKDSVVSDEINFDLIEKLTSVTKYEHSSLKEFFGPIGQDLIELGY